MGIIVSRCRRDEKTGALRSKSAHTAEIVEVGTQAYLLDGVPLPCEEGASVRRGDELLLDTEY